MTPTMEEIAGWLREAAGDHALRASFSKTASGALTHQAKEKEARDRSAQVEDMGWRPIEEAPKDATFVDLWNSSLNARVTDCLWSRGEWKKWDETDQEYLAVEDGATHFMFVPQPPVKK